MIKIEVKEIFYKIICVDCQESYSNLKKKYEVSWVRHRGIHLLTVGRYTYTSDQRFQAIHSPQNEDWTLQIRYPQIRDSGYYECQVGTTPPIGHAMVLTVVGSLHGWFYNNQNQIAIFIRLLKAFSTIYRNDTPNKTRKLTGNLVLSMTFGEGKACLQNKRTNYVKEFALRLLHHYAEEMSSLDNYNWLYYFL
ncbi:hypothetical protein AGLY_004096 [Aphis glycines]|uniref:Ig-like domain-containing protein n=1 Tax=Aphis glycines TaxID=307491 RepID=A0A6G0TY07_APHGL|nr:hypothetical protein AGLY_004096 [Aphis glycines]